MAHAIIRGANGRRHEVDFEGVEITVEVFFGDETVEIAVETPQDPRPSDKPRFALLNVPRELFNKALGEAARHQPLRGSAQSAPASMSTAFAFYRLPIRLRRWSSS